MKMNIFITGPLLAMLLVTGCSNGKTDPAPAVNNPQPAPFANSGTWHYSNANTSSSNITKREVPPPSKPQYFEFAPPTGDWLNGDKFYTASAAGEIKGGAEAGITLQAANDDIVKDLSAAGASVTFKLTERTKEGEWVRTVAEQTKHFHSHHGLNYFFTPPLPADENKHYFISAELQMNGQVKDTLVTSVYVPPSQISANVSLPQERYSSDGQLEFSMKNEGTGTISFGLDYFIERYDNETWTEVPFGGDGMRAIPSIGFSINEGAEWKETISFGNFPEGRYRVGKRVMYLDQHIPLFVEFLVE